MTDPRVPFLAVEPLWTPPTGVRIASAVPLRSAPSSNALRPPQTGEQAGPRVQHFCSGRTATWLSPERPTLIEFDGIEYPISPLEEEEGGLEAVESLLASESEQPATEALSGDANTGRFICKWYRHNDDNGA